MFPRCLDHETKKPRVNPGWGFSEAPLPRLAPLDERPSIHRSDADIVVPERYLDDRIEVFGMFDILSRGFLGPKSAIDIFGGAAG